jgi:hypothetical protein
VVAATHLVRDHEEAVRREVPQEVLVEVGRAARTVGPDYDRMLDPLSPSWLERRFVVSGQVQSRRLRPERAWLRGSLMVAERGLCGGVFHRGHACDRMVIPVVPAEIPLTAFGLGAGSTRSPQAPTTMLYRRQTSSTAQLSAAALNISQATSGTSKPRRLS